MVLNAIPRSMGSALHTLQIEPARIRAAARRMQVLRLGVVPLTAILIGVVVVLVQRVREIKGGEEDEAKKY